MSHSVEKSKVKVLVAQSFPTLCDPVGWSLPGFSIHGILQARIGKWVAIPFSGDLPDPGIEHGSAALLADSWPSELPGKPISHCEGSSQYIERNWLMSLRIHSRHLKMAPTFNIITKLTIHLIYPKDGFSRWLSGKEFACQGRRQETQVQSLGRENPWKRKWLQYSCWENPMDRGTWWVTVHGIAKSWTQLSSWAHPKDKGMPVCFQTLLKN